MATTDLGSWNDTPTTAAIRQFVASATDDGPGFVPVDERIAVFDNDGTLWCEKPMPIELGFILRRFAEMAEQDVSLRDRQPWKAAYARDYEWLGTAMTKHYRGDDGDLRLLMGAILQAFAGTAVEHYADRARTFLYDGKHPTLARPYLNCGYQPMIELLRYLEHNGFTCYIASGGDRDFMRPVTQMMYGIPSERVIGSSSALRYIEDEDGGSVVYRAENEFFDDGAVKPVRIWSRIGRRPIISGGNSNGDIEMLHYTGGATRNRLRLLVLHDDDEREFAYTAGAERALERAHGDGWTVISVKQDWTTVFADVRAESGSCRPGAV